MSVLCQQLIQKVYASHCVERIRIFCHRIFRAPRTIACYRWQKVMSESYLRSCVEKRRSTPIGCVFNRAFALWSTLTSDRSSLRALKEALANVIVTPIVLCRFDAGSIARFTVDPQSLSVSLYVRASSRSSPGASTLQWTKTPA